MICSQILSAQKPLTMKSTASGFSGEFHAGYSGWSSTDFLGDDGFEDGFGVGINLGYGVSELVEIFGGFLDYGDLSMQGFGASVGGGIKYHFSLQLAIQAGARIGFGTFNDVSLDSYEEDWEYDVTSTRVFGGLVYYF